MKEQGNVNPREAEGRKAGRKGQGRSLAHTPSTRQSKVGIGRCEAHHNEKKEHNFARACLVSMSSCCGPKGERPALHVYGCGRCPCVLSS